MKIDLTLLVMLIARTAVLPVGFVCSHLDSLWHIYLLGQSTDPRSCKTQTVTIHWRES
jgi:hypothetical protein